MALVTLGVVFAYFFNRGAIWTKLLLVASTIPIAILVNAFRVALTGFLAHNVGEEAASGAIHDFQGIFTFGFAFAMLLGEGKLIDLILRSRNRGAASLSGHTNESNGRSA